MTPHQIKHLAFRMFMRQAVDGFKAEPVMAEMMWETEPELRAFWNAEALFVVDVLLTPFVPEEDMDQA